MFASLSPGQSWRYAKHDLYTRKVVDEQVDRIATVDGSVEIDSSYKSAGKEHAPPRGWGADLLRKYIVATAPHSGELPSEIQDPWGMVVVDPHWGQVQVYEMPIPLWPAQLEPGWQTHFSYPVQNTRRPRLAPLGPDHEGASLGDG